MLWAGNLALVLEVGVVVLCSSTIGGLPSPPPPSAPASPPATCSSTSSRTADWLSDPLFSGGASTISQVAAVLEIAAATWLSVAGFVELRRRGGLARAARPLTTRLRRHATRDLREVRRDDGARRRQRRPDG